MTDDRKDSNSVCVDLARALETRQVEVSIVIVSHNGRELLAECLASVLRSTDGRTRKHVVVVDNASSDGTPEYVHAHFPEVECIAVEKNLGYAAANNLGWEFVRDRYPDTEYVCLLNQDTLVEDGWLQPLVDYLAEHDQVGCVQSKLLLHPETSLINTVGNRSHFLGFGFPGGYREKDARQFDQPTSIDYPSGAALVVRTELLRRLGLFEPLLFMYLEDAELGWKIRQFGFDIAMVPASRVFHKYSFHSDYRFYYYLERNRWWLILVHYRAATLLLLFPALAVMEVGQMYFSLKQGRLGDKLRSYLFFCDAGHFRQLWKQRRAAQLRRRIGDRAFMARFTGVIETPQLDGILVRWFANPLFAVYWFAARRLMFW